MLGRFFFHNESEDHQLDQLHPGHVAGEKKRAMVKEARGELQGPS